MADSDKSKQTVSTPPTFNKPDFMKQSRFGRPNFGVQARTQAPNIKQIRVTQHKGGS